MGQLDARRGDENCSRRPCRTTPVGHRLTSSPSRRWMLYAINWVKHALRWASGRSSSPHSQPRASRSGSYPCERVWEREANGGDRPWPPRRAGRLLVLRTHRSDSPKRVIDRAAAHTYLGDASSVPELSESRRRTPAAGGGLTRLAITAREARRFRGVEGLGGVARRTSMTTASDEVVVDC